MKDIYLQIAELIKASTDIKWIDLDSGQLDSSEARKALKYPCALVRINSAPSDIDEAGSQHEALSVQLRLAFDATGSRTSADTPSSVLNRSLAWVDLASVVYNSLQGFSNETLDQFECIAKGQEPRSDGLVVFRMNFNTGINNFK